MNFVKFPRAPFLQNSSGDCFCKQQVNEKNSFTYTPSCIFTLLSQNASFYQNASRLLLPKRLWKCESTISFRKYKRKVVLLEKQSPGRALWKRCSQRPRQRCFPANFAKFLRRPFLTEDFRWLVLLFVIYLFNYDSSKLTFFILNMAFDVLLSTVFGK